MPKITYRSEVSRLIPNQIMSKGKAGLFGAIESAANLRNVRVFTVLTVLLFALSLLLRFTVPEMRAISPAFMIFSGVMLAAALAELVFVQRKKGVGSQLKWILGVSFIVSAVTATSTLGTVGSIIFVFPMLLSIQYCSFLYSLFISAATVMGTFVPLLLSSRLGNFDLNVVRLAPGTAVQVSSTLEAALGGGAIQEAGTKVNELLSVFLPMILVVNVIAVITVIISGAIRKSLLEQYRLFQTTRE